jgi:hypothetical protein
MKLQFEIGNVRFEFVGWELSLQLTEQAAARKQTDVPAPDQKNSSDRTFRACKSLNIPARDHDSILIR